MQNATVGGKARLDDYADYLSRALVGVSLMISPHPSYPPLEMAEAGLATITNAFAGKDLRRRFDNIVSPARLDPASLADLIEDTVARMEPFVGAHRSAPASLSAAGRCDASLRSQNPRR